jgi:ribose/xylose/arabinose/galactoside ABC-type transport system permease subunit
MTDVAKFLITVGILVTLVGIVLLVVGRVPWLGRLPGDIYVERGDWKFYFPLATSLLLSVVLTVLFWLFGRR